MRRTHKLTATALMSALIVILSQITIPLPSGIPITLQIFAIALCGYILSYKYGAAALSLYIFLGMIGLPVFSGAQGGIGVLFSVTGGFIYGFFPLVILCGITNKRKSALALAAGSVGVIICHICGTIQYALIGKIPLSAAFLGASLPFILKDILSVTAAYYLYTAIRKRKVFVLF